MTTAENICATRTSVLPAAQWSSMVPIPLAEFGKSLDDPDFDQWFEAFAERNSARGQYEISGDGYLLIKPWAGMPICLYEGHLTAEVGLWNRENGGIAFSPNGCFVLPDGSYLSPAASWIRGERLRELMMPENYPFPRMAPDFVAEIRSLCDNPSDLVDKIELFLEHGTRLAWFIDAETRTAIKFRPGQEPELLNDPEYIDGDDDVLPGFRFSVRERIFDLFADIEQREELNAAGEQGSPD